MSRTICAICDSTDGPFVMHSFNDEPDEHVCAACDAREGLVVYGVCSIPLLVLAAIAVLFANWIAASLAVGWGLGLLLELHKEKTP